MDPNANLEEQRKLVARLLDDKDGPQVADAVRLAELVEGMDGWMSKGGFLPEGWQAGRGPAPAWRGDRS